MTVQLINRRHRHSLLPMTALPAQLTLAVENFKSEMLALDKQLVAGAAAEAETQHRVSETCTAVVDHFRQHIEGDHAREDDLATYMFRETFPYFTLSRLIDRSYVKPRGYAGDYLTIEMVYANEAGGDRRLGRYIDRWFLDIPASRAVKNRRQLLADIVSGVAAENAGTPVHVTSLASGPAREIFDVVSKDCSLDLRATCVDIDAEALAYTWEMANRMAVNERFRFVQANVVKLALGRESIELRDQDLVYSVGLIDYLGDRLVVALLDWIHDRLHPGGSVIVGNFDIANPSKPFMDHLLEWKLIHRTADNLVTLFQRSKFRSAPVEVLTEDTGINLFAIARRA